MRKKITFLFVVAALLVSAIAISQTTNDVPDEFTAKSWKKLNDNLQDVWLSSKKSGDMTAKFKCFLIVRDPPDSGDRDFLQSNGFNVLGATEFTTVSTGYVTAEDLPRVAKLDFVKKISLVVKKD